MHLTGDSRSQGGEGILREEGALLLRGVVCRWVSWYAAGAEFFATHESAFPSSPTPDLISTPDATPASALDSAPIVLIHGFAQSANSWDRAATLLAADGRMVYALDLIGHGGSQRPKDSTAYRLDEQAAILIAFLDEVVAREGTRPIVVGYSFGGRVALEAVCCDIQAFVHRARALVLESAGLGPTCPEERQAAAEHDAACATRLRTEGLESFMDWWERMPLFASQRDLPEDVRVRLRAGRLANNVEALARTFEQAGQHAMPDRTDVLTALTALAHEGVALSYLAGERDEKYRALAEGLLLTVAQAKEVCIVPAVGHNVHLESPTAFVQTITSLVVAGRRGACT